MFMVDKLNKRGYVAGFLLLLSLLLAMGNSMNPLVEVPCTLTDSSVFRTVAVVMQQGGMPYLDSFDHKGPLLFVYYYLGMGLSYEHGVWLFCWLSLLITGIFMYRTARLWLSRPQSCLITAVGAILMLTIFYQGGGVTEDFAMPYIAMALYFFIAYFQGKGLSTWKWFLIGWAFMSVALLRVNMVVTFLLFPPIIWFKEVLEGRSKLTVKHIIFSFVGFCLLGLIIGYWLYQGAALSACIADYIQFNMSYSADPVRASLKNKITALCFFTIHPIVLFSLLVMIEQCIKKTRKWCSFDSLYLVYIILSLLAICISGQKYGHYGMVLIPCVVYPLVLLLRIMKENISKSRLNLWKKILLIILVILTIKPLAVQIYGFHKYGYNYMDIRADKDRIGIIDEIVRRTDKQDRITVFGNENIIYLGSHRLPVSVYSYQSPIANVDNNIGEKFFLDLQQNKPKMVIIVNSIVNSPNFSKWTERMYDFLRTDCYEQVFSNDKYTLFER